MTFVHFKSCSLKVVRKGFKELIKELESKIHDESFKELAVI